MEGRVSFSDGDLTVIAELSDLSRTGVALRAVPRRLERGDLLSLQLILDPAAQEVKIDRAEVMWARKESAGLRFVELSAEARAAIEALVARPAS
jgi:hypothetical protein